MQTGLEYPLDSGRNRRGSKPWAVLLFIGFLLTMLAELLTFRFEAGADGRWVISTAQEPQHWVMILILLISLLTLVGGIFFLYHWVHERSKGNRVWSPRMVTGMDVIYTCAWLQLLQIVLLLVVELFIPQTLFAKGSAASLLETASLQLLILVVSFFQFRGRGAAVGLRRPDQPGRMAASIFILLLLILFALDMVITIPVADLFNLSLESEREREIEQEILASQKQHLLHGLASAAIIGLIVPIAEEILFRGVIQSYLVRRLGALIGIVLSSLWFALLHVDLALFAPLFMIGLGLGVLRHRFQSLWGAIILHSLNNLMSVVVYF
jgi:membrane protease YdiL (CAAX protease family)